MYLSSLLSDMNSEKYLGLYGRQMSNGKAQKNFTFTLLNSGEYMIQPLLKAEFIFSEDVNMKMAMQLPKNPVIPMNKIQTYSKAHDIMVMIFDS